MPFGTSSLLRARQQCEQDATEARKIEEKAEQRRRKKVLAKALVAATREKVPVPDGEKAHATLEPADSDRSKVFAERMGLGGDYPVDKLRLAVEGVYTSQAYNYTVTLRGGQNSRISSWCGAFAAAENDTGLYGLRLSTRVEATGTDLACKEKVDGPWLPVEFESDEYSYVKTVSGLFLPAVLEALEAEGL